MVFLKKSAINPKKIADFSVFFLDRPSPHASPHAPFFVKILLQNRNFPVILRHLADFSLDRWPKSFRPPPITDFSSIFRPKEPIFQTWFHGTSKPRREVGNSHGKLGFIPSHTFYQPKVVLEPIELLPTDSE